MFESLAYYGSIALAIYKALAIVVILASILGIAYVIKKSGELRHAAPEEKHLSQSSAHISIQEHTRRKADAVRRWQEIIARLEKQDVKDYKSALIEADALADEALRAEGMPGETMADRMRAIPSGRLSSMDEFWRAHKVRNDIAHNPHYTVSPREGHDMMRIYKKVLEELGSL